MKLKLIMLDKRNLFIQKADYDPETRIATISLGRSGVFKFLKKGIRTKYILNPDHIYYSKQKFTIQPYAIVNIGSRLSMKLGDIRNTDSLRHEDVKTDQEIKNMLDYFTESKFWGALMTKVKTPLIWIIAYMLAGAGIYSFVRMLLSVLGYQIP